MCDCNHDQRIEIDSINDVIWEFLDEQLHSMSIVDGHAAMGSLFDFRERLLDCFVKCVRG